MKFINLLSTSTEIQNGTFPKMVMVLVPISRLTAAVSRVSAAVSRVSAPVSRASAPVSRASAAVSRASAAVSRASAAVSRASALVSRASASKMLQIGLLITIKILNTCIFRYIAIINRKFSLNLN